LLLFGKNHTSRRSLQTGTDLTAKEKFAMTLGEINISIKFPAATIYRLKLYLTVQTVKKEEKEMLPTLFHGKNNFFSILKKTDEGFSFASVLLFVFAVSLIILSLDSLIFQKRKLLEREKTNIHNKIEMLNKEAEAIYESI
jgi:hypothetical protein